jgi:glycosyltransferase involved in cell wall biosynthesis
MKVALITTDNRVPNKDYGCPKPYFGTAPEALLQGFAQIGEPEVHVISCTRVAMKSPEKLASNIYFHSVRVPKIGWMRTLFAGCIWAVRKKLKQIQPDIVHGQGTEEYCSISAVLSGFPSVMTIHGNMRLIEQVNKPKPFSYHWLEARLEGWTVPRSGGVVCITNYTREAVTGMARHTWVVPNAADSSFFELNPRPPTETMPIILCVGFVCTRKNQNAFIRALDPLAEKLKFKLMFLGHASPGRTYDDEFLSLVGQRPWCAHCGFADREKLKEYFQKASVIVLPSLEDNCPMVVLEGMAAGVPVVAAKVGGVPDLIEEAKTGIFCNPNDPESMRASVANVLNNIPGAHEIAARAKVRAWERFHPKVVAERHVEIYREFLQESSVSAKSGNTHLATARQLRSR